MTVTSAVAHINEIVEIHSGYSSYVDLQRELFDDKSNLARMSRYRPIKSHREAFARLARSLNVKDKRCYLLTGSYGTGKSHLCLMFANYMQTPAGEQPMPEFFEHYAEADTAQAEELRSRRLNGRHLVAVCEWGGRGDFDELVLRAVDQALHREGFGDDLDTHYLQALKKIDQWEALDRSGDPGGQFFAGFKDALGALNPPLTLATFRSRLRNFDADALEEFRRIHQRLTTADFTYDKANLREILVDTLASKKFKDRFRGLLVVFDEFGDTMERGNLSPKMFQQFAQLAADPPAKCAQLVFVGTAHKALTSYAKAYSQTEFRTASDRVDEVALTPDGVEDIIAAIVEPKKQHPSWQEHVAPHEAVFDSLLTDCKRLKLFEWLTTPLIRSRIIENIYPMHPMATYALIQLARDIASNNRSVFTFFSGGLGGENEPGSYSHYIATTPIETNGRLNLYTADRLVDYFSAALSSDNRELRDTIRDILRDYEHSRRELNRVAGADAATAIQLKEDPLTERILRLMLVYQIIDVPNREDNVAFGLYLTGDAERQALHNRLETLAAKGVLYRQWATEVYEFRKSTAVDLDRRIDDYKRDPTHIPTNIVVELDDLVPLDPRSDLYLEAKDYNNPYNEDKRLDRRLVRAADLAAEITTPEGKRTYFQRLDQQLASAGKDSDYEGIALYAVCEIHDDIQKAREFAAKNESDRIVVAVPKAPVQLLDAVLTLRALQAIEESEDAKDFSTQDKAALNARLHGQGTQPGARDHLKRLRDQLLAHRNVAWFYKYGQPLPVDDNKPYDAANRVMDLLYGDSRNSFAHDDFNQLRAKVRRNQTALKEAVEKLLDYTQGLVIDTSFAQNRGDKRYLERCLLQQGALRQVKTEGSKFRCEVEQNEAAYEKNLPALAAMVREVKALSPDAKLSLANWLVRYRQAPYGQGPIALALALAFIRRQFGDSIHLKAEESQIGEMALSSFDTAVDLLDGKYPGAFISYRPLRPEENALTTEVFKVFGQPDSAADAARTRGVQEAYEAIRQWWDSLPSLAHVAKLYASDEQPEAARFVAAMQKIAAREPHSFVFDDLPEVFGAEAGLAITKETVSLLKAGLPKVKEVVEGTPARVENRVLEDLRELFGVQQHTISDLADAIRAWYNGLDSHQRDSFAPWHTCDSKPLAVFLSDLSDPRATLLDKIPASSDYGLKRVRDWMADRVAEYLASFRRGKELIEKNRVLVASPEVVLAGDYEREGGEVRFKGAVTVTFQARNSGDQVYVVEGGADPVVPGAHREPANGVARTIKDNKVIRYVVQDTDGNYGRVDTLRFINESDKFLLTIQKSMGDDVASFIMPRDHKSLAITCRSLFSELLKRKAVTQSQLETTAQQVLDDLRKPPRKSP